MGRNKNCSSIKLEKMKLSLALAAVAQANPTQWMINEWWNQAVSVFNFSNSNWEAFSNAVSSVPEDQWEPLWNFCNSNGDAVLSSDELVQCGKRAGDYLGMPEAHQNFLYDFAAKYWDAVDQDGSGDLSYNEYKYVFGGFAALTPASSLPLSTPTQTAFWREPS